MERDIVGYGMLCSVQLTKPTDADGAVHPSFYTKTYFYGAFAKANLGEGCFDTVPRNGRSAANCVNSDYMERMWKCIGGCYVRKVTEKRRIASSESKFGN